MNKYDNSRNTHFRLGILGNAIASIFCLNTYVFADPIDPAVNNVTQFFSQETQVNFDLYADSENSNLVWYSPRFGSIALNRQLNPDFAVNVEYPSDGIFAGQALIDIEGKLDTSGIATEIIDLEQEAKLLGYDIAPIRITAADTTFLVAGFPVGSDGRIDAQCDSQVIDTPFGPVSVPFCQATDKDGVVRPLDFLYSFTSTPPVSGTSISQNIPFEGTTLPGWEFPIRDLMSFGQSWDQLFQVVTNWTIKTTSEVDVARVSVTWPILFRELSTYVSNCRWSCTQNEINFLYEEFLNTPSDWGLVINYRQVDGSYGPIPASQNQRLQTKNKLVDVLGPELFVAFVDDVVIPTFGELRNIGPLAKASASSTFCSGPNPSAHCYSPRRANDGNTDTSLGGFSSWTNAGGPLPQFLELNWPEDYDIHKIDVYTSEGFPISDFDLEILNKENGRWENIATVNNNTLLKITAFSGRAITNRLRVRARRGPDRQTIYTRINEIVVTGREVLPNISEQQTFFTLRSNIEKILRQNPEIIQLSSGDPNTLRTSSTLMYLQCMTGGFGTPVTWAENPRCGYNATTNIATLATASATSSYCPSPSATEHCYFPSRANDGITDTRLGGQSSWSNDRTPTLPQWWQLQWPSRVRANSITVYTSENYEIQDFDIQYFDDITQAWITLKEVRGNQDIVVKTDFPEVITSRIRIMGLKGPNRQTFHVRLNEVVVEGRPE